MHTDLSVEIVLQGSRSWAIAEGNDEEAAPWRWLPSALARRVQAPVRAHVVTVSEEHIVREGESLFPIDVVSADVHPDGAAVPLEQEDFGDAEAAGDPWETLSWLVGALIDEADDRYVHVEHVYLRRPRDTRDPDPWLLTEGGGSRLVFGDAPPLELTAEDARYVVWRLSDVLAPGAPPDLTRWRARLLTSAGLSSVPGTEDERWWTRWWSVTRAERAATTPDGRTPSWKLTSPGRWVLTLPECRHLSTALDRPPVPGHTPTDAQAVLLAAVASALGRAGGELEVIVEDGPGR
ncbi:MAG: hypothetical protein H6735_28500 [Alphaproteobacteria bacterium]|nr:hypothetical protein [Alphaproteobacteria bacterium]